MSAFFKRRLSLFIASVAVLLVIISAFSPVHYSGEKNTVLMSASWIYNYRDIEEISKDSDLIALVKVDSVAQTQVCDNLPFTSYNATITDFITGAPDKSTGDNIVIKMTGGEHNSVVYEIADDPLLHPDDEFLVFCKKSSDGSYTIISGPQGRLEYCNGKLNSLNVSNARVRDANPYSSIVVNGADYDSMKLEILEYTS